MVINWQTRCFAQLLVIFAVVGMLGQSTAEAQTVEEKLALTIYRRVAGVKIGLDDARIQQMAQLIREQKMEQAAAIPAEDSNFYGITVREFAAKMSNRDLVVSAPLTDFVATIVGMARDGVDAREMLTGDFYYAADPSKVMNVPNNDVDDFLTSNNHYEFLEDNAVDLKDALIRVDGQKLVGNAGAAVAHRDPAGVLTSRSFMAAHAIDGTNRRLVEYTFKSFTCLEINQWADTSVSDIYVGRDVERFPEGSNNRFQATCKGCHSGMDSMRPAFALVDFDDGYLKHADLQTPVDITQRNNPDNDEVNDDEIAVDNWGVPYKFTRATDTFPEGYIVKDDSWVNLATTSKHDKLFGYRSATSGNGMGDLGKMVSESRGFSSCMVQRAFESVCKRSLKQNEDALKRLLTDKFEGDYDLKKLFVSVASRMECVGQ